MNILIHYIHFQKDFLNNAIKKILELNDKIIGFSLYTTNRECTFWMIRKLKQLRPDIKIVIGGPEI